MVRAKSILLSLGLLVSCWSSGAVQAERLNILLIAIDDLNHRAGCLVGLPQARSSNIDRLDERGTLFTGVHCQAPICNPSRASIMYGMRPSTSGVYMNSQKLWTVEFLRKRVTRPRHFAASGDKTDTAGRIYHGSGLPPGDFDQFGPWSGQQQKIDELLIRETREGARFLVKVQSPSEVLQPDRKRLI